MRLKKTKTNQIQKTKTIQMNNTFFITSMLLLTCSSSFAQKDELKEVEKLLKKNNPTEAAALLHTVEKLLPNATDDQKAAYYFYTAKNQVALAKNGIDFNENRSNAIASIKQLLKFENETKSKRFTTETLDLKNTLLAELVDEAIDTNRAKNYQKSSRLFEQAYQLNPIDTVYLYYAANDAVSAKDFDFAESKFKDLIKLKYDGKSNTYVATSQTSGKVESFGLDKKARDLAVKSGSHTQPETVITKSSKPSIYNNLTHILLNKQNFSEAEQYALTAYDLDKDNVNALLNVLFLYYNTNRLDKYEEFAKKGLERFPENEVLLYNLAVIHLGNNQTEKAVEYLHKIVLLNPSHFEALKSLGNIELQKDADITTKINALPNTNASTKKRNELMQEKKSVYNNTLAYYLKAQKVNAKDEGLNDLIKQIQTFLSQY